MEHKIEQLLTIMRALRTPETGCPWDLKQTYKSIIPYTIEEAYEVADAIEQGDFEELKHELGDLLFQVVFYCQLAIEDNKFEFNDVIDSICEKLTRRHPHVFSDQTFLTDEQIKSNWEAEKQKERQLKSNDHKPLSILANVPNNLPALSRANKIQKRCAHVGFDWPDHQGALDKVKEEIVELEQELALTDIDQNKVAEEMGDLMFAMVNLTRKLKLDPEATLRAANIKFQNRFQQLENNIQASGQGIEQLSLSEMEAVWQQIKLTEQN